MHLFLVWSLLRLRIFSFILWLCLASLKIVDRFTFDFIFFFIHWSLAHLCRWFFFEGWRKFGHWVNTHLFIHLFSWAHFICWRRFINFYLTRSSNWCWNCFKFFIRSIIRVWNFFISVIFWEVPNFHLRIDLLALSDFSFLFSFLGSYFMVLITMFLPIQNSLSAFISYALLRILLLLIDFLMHDYLYITYFHWCTRVTRVCLAIVAALSVHYWLLVF